MRKHHEEESSSMGRNPEGKLPFPLTSKGGRFIICMERDSDTWRERT
jgi:hypothetical protein